MRNRHFVRLFGALAVAAMGIAQATAQQEPEQPAVGQGREVVTPVAAAAPAGTDAPQGIFVGRDEAGQNPETFSLNKEKGIGTFTTFGGPMGQLIYNSNSLKYLKTDANNFAYYEAEGLDIEFAFLTKGPQFNPAFSRKKGTQQWSKEGMFGRYMPRGDFFK